MIARPESKIPMKMLNAMCHFSKIAARIQQTIAGTVSGANLNGYITNSNKFVMLFAPTGSAPCCSGPTKTLQSKKQINALARTVKEAMPKAKFVSPILKHTAEAIMDIAYRRKNPRRNEGVKNSKDKNTKEAIASRNPETSKTVFVPFDCEFSSMFFRTSHQAG